MFSIPKYKTSHLTGDVNGEGGMLPPSVPPYRTVLVRVISYDNVTSFLLFLEAFHVLNLNRPSRHNVTKLFLLTRPVITYNVVALTAYSFSICTVFRDLSNYEIEKIASFYIQFCYLMTKI